MQQFTIQFAVQRDLLGHIDLQVVWTETEMLL